MSEAAQQVKTNGKMPPAVIGKKRQYTPEFKKEIQARVKAGEAIPDIAKQHNIHTTQIARWARGESLGKFGSKGGKKKAAPKKKYKPVDERVGAKSYLMLPNQVKDAQTWMYTSLQSGVIAEFDEAHDLSRMALRELQKLAEK